MQNVYLTLKHMTKCLKLSASELMFVYCLRFVACQDARQRVRHGRHPGHPDVLHEVHLLLGRDRTARGKQALLRQAGRLRVRPAHGQWDGHRTPPGRGKQHQLPPQPGAGGHLHQPQLLTASPQNGQFVDATLSKMFTIHKCTNYCWDLLGIITTKLFVS